MAVTGVRVLHLMQTKSQTVTLLNSIAMSYLILLAKRIQVGIIRRGKEKT